MKKIKNCIIFTNGMVSCFDENGDQIGDCQGFILDVAEVLKNNCDEDTRWQFGKWGGYVQDANFNWYWENMKNIDKGEKVIKIKSKFPKSVLLEVKWKGHDLAKCAIYYKNRGSPNDTAIVMGKDIKNIDSMFLILEGIPEEKYIPYHRIFKIEYDGDVIFEHY